jgi:hypothetical protein
MHVMYGHTILFIYVLLVMPFAEDHLVTKSFYLRHNLSTTQRHGIK